MTDESLTPPEAPRADGSPAAGRPTATEATPGAGDTGVGEAATVATVRGEVPVSDLGTALMHEHVFVLTPDSQANWPGEWDEEREVAGAIAALQALVASGVRTIADPTVDGLGRNVARIARVNAAVPELNIVVATGVYTYTDVPFYFAFRGPGALPDLPDPMTELFVRDLTVGIQGTGIRAGFLKCAIDQPGLTGGVHRVLRAVAAAHRATGAPVMVHTHPGSHTGRVAADVLAAEGVAAHAVLLAHSGDTTDVEHLSALADGGYLLGMDRFGLDTVADTATRVATVAELCRRGHAAAMVLAHDAACYIDWLAPELRPLLPNWHYQHIGREVVPALRARGVSADDLHTMLVVNPAEWLSGSRGAPPR